MRKKFTIALFIIAFLSFGLFLTTTTAIAASSHTVQYGDTLGKIAGNYGVSADSIIAANNIVNPNLIFVGQVLTIPGAGEVVPPSNSGVVNGTHTVQAGDTLAAIAARYGVSMGAIQNANGISNPNFIFVNQVLAIPNGAAGSAPAAPVQGVNAYKSVIVDLSDQRTYVYENGQLVYNFISSTGQPGSETWTGTWSVRTKLPNAYAYTWDLQMPYWIGFYHTGSLENGFHALPILSNGQTLWEGYLGTPISYGCVVLSSYDAATLYNWIEIGTEVIVRY